MVEENNADKLNKEMARDTWKHRREQVDKSLDYTIQFGHAALKAPGIANMAAFAAYLGFLSANTARLTDDSIASIEACFVWFAVGVITSALASGCAYFTQYAYTEADNSYETSLKPPYIKDKPHWARCLSILLHLGTSILVILSYFALIWGAWWLLVLVKAVVV